MEKMMELTAYTEEEREEAMRKYEKFVGIWRERKAKRQQPKKGECQFGPSSGG